MSGGDQPPGRVVHPLGAAAGMSRGLETADPAVVAPGPQGLPDPAAVRRRLLRWFRRNARTFFWREDLGGIPLSPFQVLLVEFLLWKTSARSEETIRRIVLAHPTPVSVLRRSIAELESDLRPLGLFRRRAKCLLAFSRELVDEHGGDVPRDVVDLQGLTGIGQYAARATACLLSGSRLMPVDANTARIFGRLFGDAGPGVREPGAGWDARLSPFVPRRDPRRFLWATMDLAARTCTIRNPRCAACPLRAECRTGTSTWSRSDDAGVAKSKGRKARRAVTAC